MGSRSLIINLITDTSSIKRIVDGLTREGGCWSFINFSSIRFEHENAFCFSARDYDQGNGIERKSIREYVEWVGEFSLQDLFDGGNVRQFKVNGLPVYWLTSFAEKHPFYHWLFSFLFFKDFIADKPDFLDGYEEVVVIAPIPERELKDYIDGSCQWIRNDIRVISVSRPVKLNLFGIYYRALRFYIKFIPSYIIRCIYRIGAISDEPPEFLLVKMGNSGSETFLQECVRNILSEHGNVLDVKFDEIMLHPGKCKSGFLLKQYPSPLQVFHLLTQIVRCGRRIRRSYYSKTSDKDFRVGILIPEVYRSVHNVHLYVIHLWLKNIFKNIQRPLKVFYEDEMYRTGRIISSAAIIAENHHIRTIGYQHGNISESHTVYRFSNLETTPSKHNKKDHVPLPDIFLVWGDHFKRQFLEWFSFDSNRVIVAGNPAYLNILKNQSSSMPGSGIHKVLWCTTSIDLARSEFDIISSELEKGYASITVRMHPNFDIKEELREFIPERLYTSLRWDCSKSIWEALENTDLVLSGSHSSVYIDCLVFGKPVIRLMNSLIMNDRYLLKQDTWIKSVYTAGEFSNALNSFQFMPLAGHRMLDYLYLKDNKVWHEVASGKLSAN